MKMHEYMLTNVELRMLLLEQASLKYRTKGQPIVSRKH